MIRNGDRIVDGKLKAGLVIGKGICAHCWKHGVIVDLLPPHAQGCQRADTSEDQTEAGEVVLLP